ncbi:site-specific integrase [Haloferax sp. Q22]|uniref:site-specific integrase n=1 Tax=Haloferax sp. (strain Q22) TaxID=1526048 RepID=UPI000737C7E2|nr:site-specific integrase [Haloferax sp. Q22]
MPITDFGRQLANTVENIEESDEILDRNKELILDYKQDQVLNGLSEATLLRNTQRLKIVAQEVEKPFDEMDKSDVKAVIVWLHNRDYTDETVDTYKTVIKTFWGWLKDAGKDETPEEVKWIQLTNGNGNGDTLPKDLLTKDEIEAQVDAAKNPRDKALIYMLYETGARIGELIDLTVGDIEDRKHGKKVVIDGKTGARRLPLVESVPHINNWLNKHPNPEKGAPLWCKIQQGSGDDQLGYRYIREKILQKNMERAGIDKPSNPHHYRHSRASHLATELKEAQLCEWFGWVQGSDVPARYVHLSGRDIDNAYDQMHGLYEPDEDEDTPSVVECWRCEELNEPNARYCGRCGAPLDDDAQSFNEQVEEDITADYRETDPEDIDTLEAIDTINELIQRPDVKAILDRDES